MSDYKNTIEYNTLSAILELKKKGVTATKCSAEYDAGRVAMLEEVIRSLRGMDYFYGPKEVLDMLKDKARQI